MAVAVDVALFAIRADALHLLLVERGVEPFRGAWALPGGFVQPSDETLDAAAARELAEETSIAPGDAHLEQLGAYGEVGRDPRMRVVSVAYWAACAGLPRPAGGSDAARAELVPVSRLEEGRTALAFDHDRIAADALARLRSKLEYTAVATRFCPPAFTITELRRVYEAVWNTELDAGNFQRKVRGNEPFRELQESRKKSDWAWADADGSAVRPAFDAPFMVLAAAATPGFRRATAVDHAVDHASRRGGRPASLWTTENSAALLDLPIARPRGAAPRGNFSSSRLAKPMKKPKKRLRPPRDGAPSP